MTSNMLLDAVDNYCERLAPGLFAEPINALTNIAFFIAAWLLYGHYKKSGKKDGAMAFAIMCVALVGLGSLLFHTFANKLTLIGDVAPISLFVCYYLFLVFRRLIGYQFGPSLVGAIFFFAMCLLFALNQAGTMLNGSASYFPCLAAIVVIYQVLRQHTHPAAIYFKRAMWVFTCSLVLRSTDLSICPLFPLGTHFMWHLLNGWVLFLLVRALFVPRHVSN